MPRNRFVIITGLTGVGKTTVLNRARSLNDQHQIHRLSYGTILLEMAKEMGLVEHRDEITDIPPEPYDNLQERTAEQIDEIISTAKHDDPFVLDTHAALNTPYGYRPGLPQEHVKIMDPDQLVFIQANPFVIHKRRDSDDERDRDVGSVNSIKEHQDVARQMISANAAMTGAPVKMLDNPSREIEQVAVTLTEIILESR